MAILEKDKFFEVLKSHIGDDNSDTSIQFLEDMTDTYNDLESKAANKDNEDWKSKYEANDKMWRDKYTSRFFNSSEGDKELPKPEGLNDGEGDNSPKKFEELFKEGD